MDHQPKISEKEEITVLNVQSMIKELNERGLPDQPKFFSGEENLNKNKIKIKKKI